MDVSRETQARLERYFDLLCEWQQRFNLVAPSTLAHARQRHFEDSLQLLDLLKAKPKIWVDFGSGAGFPGMVVAAAIDVDMHLVEATAKKCRFLTHVAQELGISKRVRVHNRRAESMSGPKADIISARACAPLPKLFDWGRGFAAERSVWLLPKGRNVAAELAAAEDAYRFDYRLHGSRTDPEARIVVASNVRARTSGHRGRRQTPNADTGNREPEGRRRQDHDNGQPRDGACGDRSANAGDRSRSARQ